MDAIRITKEFTFEMAHALAGYNGKCRDIHGHSYSLSVTVKGTPKAIPADPTSGMVMDFTALKKIVSHEIIEVFDHALVINESDKRFTSLLDTTKLIKTPYQPSCENLLIDFVSRLEKYFQGDVKLHSLMLRETSTCYAEWFADDN